MAPVIAALQASPWAVCRVLATAQHREMLDQMLAFFGIAADGDLDVMQDGQSLAELTSRLLVRLDAALAAESPDIVLAQGDTTTVLATALACFYRRTPFAHVEAGLRTGSLAMPFPEEANRALAARLTALHFAPTPRARANLLAEGLADESIHVVGNTVVDALHTAAAKDAAVGVELTAGKRLIFVTAHRRESLGQPLRNICRAVAALADRYRDVEFLWPVHPNPSVASMVRGELGDRPAVRLCEPLDYGAAVSAMKRAAVLLTDSGGLQEEGPALGKPVLVMRDRSERPEAIEAGVARLVGTDCDLIVAEVSRLLDDPAAYRRMVAPGSIFGDGHAGRRIADIVARFLGVPGIPEPAPYSPPSRAGAIAD